VADTGSGIDKQGLKKIFTPFERLGADRNAIGGTGLGLALSKRMVEAMGGTIGVESTVGAGSRFYFELALVEHATEAKLDYNFHPGPTASSYSASYVGTILYIEDNLSNIRLMEQILARYTGVRLLVAMQGKLGLDLAHMHTPDWILLDLHLPDMPGEGVLRALKQDRHTQRIPVTILSADATPGQINHLQTAGAREYLTKPFQVSQIIALLEYTLRGEQLTKQPEAGARTDDKPDMAVRWAPEAITLTGLPTELLEQLRIAVQDGEKDRLDELIATVSEEHSQSARALKALADRYEYDALTNLLTEASR
jgi:CheY-like chemotaxis protein